ncbi:hypothetical protein L21TH_2270 [Caldisalinibacter kiritimatiensis]|uniref:Uncharacterized protein n=1 Tax=Caldisalinibacter kiritimatiensis TaxID=1304284 RepID=R1CSL7_9FIRM|nr:hypothetical protein L21TH_2270 [Caldisalinibacter kiritimatiensis]
MIKKVSLTIMSVILLFTIITTVKGLGTFEYSICNRKE